MDGTARGNGRMRRTRRPRGVAAAAGGLACLALTLAPAGAEAGMGASAVPNFPADVTVGNVGVPAVIELRNTNTDVNAGQTNVVCNFGDGAPCPAGDPGITLIPSCSRLGAFSACTGAEPGVFRISDLATGQAGTACAAMVFNVSLIDPANGQVRLHAAGRCPRGAARRGRGVPDRLLVLRAALAHRRPECRRRRASRPCRWPTTRSTQAG